MNPSAPVVWTGVKDQDIYRRLGAILRRRRRLLGLTQSQVAASCGTTFQQVQKYEAGLGSVSVSRLFRLADALKTSPADLIAAAGAEFCAAPQPAVQSEPDRTAVAHGFPPR
jgi:transcriptional regulator with XRE-family HTH domain